MAMQRRMRGNRHYEQEGASMRDWLFHVGGVIRESGTVAGILCKSASRSPLHWWDYGASPPGVFPLPLPSLLPLPSRGRSRRRAQLRREDCVVLDLWVATLNSMYAGRGGEDVCSSRPSAAQVRCLMNLQKALRDHLRGSPGASGVNSLRDYLQTNDRGYGGGVARPLGMDAGVPPQAGDVALGDLLEDSDVKLAAQVRDPAFLLLPEAEWPQEIPTVRSLLGKDYAEFVERNVAVGLQDLAEEDQVATVQGQPLVAAAFAVGKADTKENRMISGCVGTNSLMNPALLPRPRYAYIPRMRACTISKFVRLRVSKRDARHYFHRLRLGIKWRPWLAHPPITRGGKKLYPRHTCAAMGLAPSSGWAQALTDQTTSAANLPMEHRVLIDEPAPLDPPFWGSIVDDVWCLDTSAAPAGAAWCDRVHQEWQARGVETHAGKIVDEVEGQEIQGVFVHASEHWLGVSLQKRSLLMRGLWFVLSQHKPRVSQVDRLVGKLGFAMSFNVCCRSVLTETFAWLALHRKKYVRAVLWPAVFDELIQALLLIPFLQFSISKPWCPRVEAADASPGGHGRAWSVFQNV